MDALLDWPEKFKWPRKDAAMERMAMRQRILLNAMQGKKMWIVCHDSKEAKRLETELNADLERINGIPA